MPELHLFNTLTGKKEAFRPALPGHVRLYACGPTVYNYAHIGNARMAVVFDLLVRVLRQVYPKVTYASNITDVDDKIMQAAQETGEKIDAITRKYERIYNEDMAALGCTPPDIQPRATEHIAEMIRQIEQLIERDHAYVAEENAGSNQGTVLFHVPSYPAYGRLSNRSRDEQIAGARVEVASYKKDPADFVLWKPSTPAQPGWNSPWGFGRPGWHIECSAMSEKYLSPLPFDIHGGGADLKFPHHENEIAQSCCAHGHENDPSQFARFWVHNGFLTVENEKMSKSLGNFRLVHDLLQHHSGEVLRLTLLSGHYRQPLDWSLKKIAETKSFLDSLYRTLYDLREVKATEVKEVPAVTDALQDDLNTPMAIAAIKAIEREAASKKTSQLKGELLGAGKLFGILQQDPAAWLGYGQAGDADVANIERLIQERQNAKKEKNFARADEIRKKLTDMGIALEDTPAGPKWKKIAG
ncbi:MAG TPA: cysteine--tRNA ligase [Patescibacteria group bacterium]|nr:cysteine--tRNA ligase [Patescibacteria group bacterium]